MLWESYVYNGQMIKTEWVCVGKGFALICICFNKFFCGTIKKISAFSLQLATISRHTHTHSDEV